MSTAPLAALSLIGLSVILSVCGQLVLKLGVTRIGATDLGAAGALGQFFARAALSPLVLAGFAMYGLSAVAWLIVLSKLKLSFAYPFLALNFVLITILSRLVLDEPITPARWIGIALICIGVAVIGRS